VTPEDLETAYDQARWAANMQEVLTRHGLMSERARQAIGDSTRIAYGAANEEKLDIYKARGTNAPIVVFIHGGGWQRGSAKDHSFPAEMLLAENIHFIAMDFSSVADTDGDLSILVDQIRRGIFWIYQNASSFGGDANKLYLVGHSSGAHLAAMTLSTRWADYELQNNPIKGGFIVSGIYDLAPLRKTSRSNHIKLNDKSEHTLSPIRQVAQISCSISMWVGSKESPEFDRQSREYASVARAAGKDVKLAVGDTYNHFDILDTLGNPYGLLGRDLIRFVGTGHL